jgi:hypothetical protein
LLWIGQCVYVINTEFVSTTGDLTGPQNPWAGALSTDQHWQGIVQNIAGAQMTPEVPLGGECSIVAVQVDLRRTKPLPVPYADQPDAHEPSASRLTPSAAEAQSSLGHLLVEHVVGSDERVRSQPTEVPPRLQAIRIAPTLRTDDATLAQGSVDIRGRAEVPSGMAPNVGIQVLAVV